MAVVQGISGRVKRYVSVTARMDEDGHVRLQPENHVMSPIIVERADVRGKIVALIRRF